MSQSRNKVTVQIVIRIAMCGALALFLSASVAFAEDNEVLTDGTMKPIGVDVVPRGIPRSWNNNDLFPNDNRVTTASLDVGRLQAEDQLRTQGPARSGVVQKFQPLSSAVNENWIDLGDGGRLWTMTVVARGAKGIRLHVSPFNPPPGAELFVYAPGDVDSIRGPITSAYQPVEELWTPTIYGSEEIRLEYYLPPEVDVDDPGVHIIVDSVLNDYRTLGVGGNPLAGGPLPCHLDVRCFPSWELESRGVGPISFVSNQFGFFCSSAMLTRVGNDFTPLLMTAFHCGINSSNANSLLVTWFYRTNSCNGVVPNLNTLPQTQGIVLLKNNNANDFTLVGLSRANTGGVTFQGWTSSTSWANNSPSVAIHHPRGSWQRIAFGVKEGTFVSCVNGANDGWHTEVLNGNGLTEPGSSGSPVFDSNSRVRGTLSCGTFGCNQTNTQTYGRFGQAYPALRPWLNPADPIYLDAGYGGTEEGTSAQPFNSVLEGTFAVLAGSTIHMDAGTYDGPSLVIDKPVTLRSTGGLVTIQ